MGQDQAQQRQELVGPRALSCGWRRGELQAPLRPRGQSPLLVLDSDPPLRLPGLGQCGLYGNHEQGLGRGCSSLDLS